MIGEEEVNYDVSLIFAVLNGRVSATINRKLLNDFRENNIDITPEQLSILSFLWKKDKVTQQELCNVTFKDKPNMTRLIDSLEGKGMVKRTADPKDKRNNLIVLTAKGRRVEQQAFLVANESMHKALYNVTTEELTLGQNLLNKIFNNMQEKPVETPRKRSKQK